MTVRSTRFLKFTSKAVTLTECLSSVAPIEYIIRAQVKQGFRRRNSVDIEQVFKKYAIVDPASPTSAHLPKDKVLVALKEFDVGSKDISESDLKDADFIFNSLDINSDGKLDFGEFQAAVQTPSLLEEWARSLNVHQLVADAIPRNEGENPLITASTLSPDVITLIAAGVTDGLEEILRKEVERLRASFARMKTKDVNNLAQKFQSKAPKMNCGNFEDFHRGLTAHIGTALVSFPGSPRHDHVTRASAVCSKSQRFT